MCVAQELALAKDVSILCGTIILDYEDIYGVALTTLLSIGSVQWSSMMRLHSLKDRIGTGTDPVRNKRRLESHHALLAGDPKCLLKPRIRRVEIDITELLSLVWQLHRLKFFAVVR